MSKLKYLWRVLKKLYWRYETCLECGRRLNENGNCPFAENVLRRESEAD